MDPEKNFQIIRYICNYQFCKESIEEGADVNHYTIDGYFPLYYAATFNLEETCSLLIEKGANVNQKTRLVEDPKRNTYNHESLTSLWAAQTIPVCKILINAGIDVNAINRKGYTALDDTILYSDNYDKAILLIENGSDLNSTNSKKLDSTFSIIVKNRKKYLYHIALQYGANPNTIIREYGKYAIDIAILDNDTDFIDLLIKYGANIPPRYH